GLAGLRPTHGRLSLAGVVPLSQSFDTVGPIARTVEDAALMLQALAGPDVADPATEPVPVPDYRATLRPGLQGLRVAVPRPYFWDRLGGAGARPGAGPRLRGEHPRAAGPARRPGGADHAHARLALRHAAGHHRRGRGAAPGVRPAPDHPLFGARRAEPVGALRLQ